MIAPIPPADRRPPAESLSYPAFASNGHATDPKSYRRGYAGTGRAAEKKRREGDGSSRAAGLPPVAANEKLT